MSYGRNEPDLGVTTSDDLAIYDAGRMAWSSLRKTFEQWIAIGKTLQRMEENANRIGGRNTFVRLQLMHGLITRRVKGVAKPIDKAIVSKLLKIMSRLPDVVAWHAGLEPGDQVAWSSPSSVVRHCPIFNEDKANEPKKPSPYKQLQELHMQTLQKSHHLEQENHKLKQRQDDEIFKSSDSYHDIAVAVVGRLEQHPDKARKVAREMLKILKEREPRAAQQEEVGAA